jgi:hypothetical protein
MVEDTIHLLIDHKPSALKKKKCLNVGLWKKIHQGKSIDSNYLPNV